MKGEHKKKRRTRIAERCSTSYSQVRMRSLNSWSLYPRRHPRCRTAGRPRRTNIVLRRDNCTVSMNLYDVLVRYKNGEHPRAQKLPMRLAAEETPELSSVAAYTKQKTTCGRTETPHVRRRGDSWGQSYAAHCFAATQQSFTIRCMPLGTPFS